MTALVQRDGRGRWGSAFLVLAPGGLACHGSLPREPEAPAAMSAVINAPMTRPMTASMQAPEEPAPLELTLDDPESCSDRAALHDLSGLDETQKTGYLAPERIREVVRSHYPSLIDCFEAGKHPVLGGKVTLRFAIGLEGNVSDLSIWDNDVPDCAVVQCIRAHASRIEFPHPKGGVVLVQYPIMLKVNE
jgi:hypothetical protein